MKTLPLFTDLSSERLTYRRLTLDDIPAWMSFINSERAMTFMKYQPGSEEACRKWIDGQLNRYAQNGFGLYAIIEKSSGQLVGQCGLLTQHVDEEDVIEIGYHLLPDYWGNGYATEAAKFWRDLGFEHDVAAEITSLIHVENEPSMKVAIRNGMLPIKKTICWDLPIEVFAIDRARWEEVR